MSTENEIKDAVADIKAKLEQAGSLDRKTFSTAVAQMLFNQRKRPTGGMVIGYTKLGSTSDVIRDVNEFWAELKDRLDSSMAVPSAFKDIASKLVVELWSEAQSQAGEEFEALKQEYASTLDLKSAELDSALISITELNQKLEGTGIILEERQAIINQFTSSNEGLISECAAWKENIENLNRLLDEERSARKSESEAFMLALDKEREERSISEARLKDEKNYAMMEIDKARQEAIALAVQKDQKIKELNEAVSVFRNQSNDINQANGRLKLDIERMKGVVEGIESELALASSRNNDLMALLGEFAKSKKKESAQVDAQPTEPLLTQYDNKE